MGFWVYGFMGLWVFMSVNECHGCIWVSMGAYGCLWVSMIVYGFLGVYGCLWGLEVSGYLWVLMGVMTAYGYYIQTFKILPIFSFKNPRRFENPRKHLKSHMCYKKKPMHHEGKGLYRPVCFQYSSMKFLFSPLVHNILL